MKPSVLAQNRHAILIKVAVIQYSDMISICLVSIQPQEKDIIEKCKKVLRTVQLVEMSRIIAHDHLMHKP